EPPTHPRYSEPTPNASNPARTRGTKSAMYMATTTPKVLSPRHFHNRDRCSAVIIETSTLNCSANSATTASASDCGPSTATSAGNAGKDKVRAHTLRTNPVRRPEPGDPGDKDTNRSSTTALLRLAHRRHVEIGYPQRRHRRPGGPIAPFARQRLLTDPGLGGPPQQAQRALVEAEVVDRRGHLAVLDEVHAVAGQPGEQQGGRVDLADVPQRGQQQPALGGGD